MSEYYEIEEIICHRARWDNTTEYLVKWKGYDSSHNSWEPKENFVSINMIDDYHASLGKYITVKKEDAHNFVTRDYMIHKDIISSDEIKERQMVPKKVINIFHMQHNEKELVALIQFEGKDREFVTAEWANHNCPDLVIKFYEGRIYWRQKNNGKLVKKTYA